MVSQTLNVFWYITEGVIYIFRLWRRVYAIITNGGDILITGFMSPDSVMYSKICYKTVTR